MCWERAPVPIVHPSQAGKTLPWFRMSVSRPAPCGLMTLQGPALLLPPAEPWAALPGVPSIRNLRVERQDTIDSNRYRFRHRDGCGW